MKLYLAALLALAVGCSSSAPQGAATFWDEAEELEYLSSLSQPTVEQFHRHKELAASKARREEDERDRNRGELKVKRDAEAEAALKKAKEWEDIFVPGSMRAAEKYREIREFSLISNKRSVHGKPFWA